MNIASFSIKILNYLLGKLGFQIEKKKRDLQKDALEKAAIPEAAEKYLTEDNSRLLELRHSYELLKDTALERSLWTQETISRDLDLLYFRSDNIYVWQHRDNNQEINYAITLNYIKSIDKLNLLEVLTEDSLFGVETFIIDDNIVSRDLLDSIIEIYFLERNLKISEWRNLNVLDIGAGYGKLAHRISCALPNLNNIYCVDAIPESTFLCEYYLGFRNVKNAHAVPLPEIGNIMSGNRIDIATNICSFSEIPLSSINWWINLLGKHRVKYLMVVPDGGLPLVSHEKDGTKVDFEKTIYEAGYKLKTKENKYLMSSVQKYGISPSHQYLFELEL